MRRPSPLLASLTLSALALGLAGCGQADPSSDPEPAADSPSQEASSADPSETPSVTADPTPTEVPNPSTLLLSASALPGFNDPWRWSERDTTPDPITVGACFRIPMETIGADEVVTRRFVPTGDDGGGTATQVVGRFVDDRSADQASSVIAAFHAKCAASGTKGAKVTVGKQETVPTDKGQASWYLTTIVKNGADEGRFNALGVLRDGLTIELVEYDSVGQDYNYAPGQEPAARALKAAAKLLP